MRVQRRYHPDGPAVVFVGLTLLVGVGSMYSGNNLMILIFGAMLGALLLSGVVSGAMLLRLSVKREPLYRGRAGKPTVLAYTLHNRARWLPAYALTVAERTPSRRARRRTAQRPSPRCDFRPGAAAFVPAGEHVRVWAEAEPAGRGVVRLEGVVVSTRFPFGLLRKSVTFPQPAELLVWPAVVDTPLGVAAPSRRTGRGDSSPAPRPALGRAGEEFFSLRSYQRGDSPKHIAWRATARRGQLVVREHAAERRRLRWVVLRIPAGASDESAEAAISRAAGEIELATARNETAGLFAPDFDLRISPGSPTAALLDALALLDTSVRAEATRHPAPPGQHEHTTEILATTHSEPEHAA